jgi:hypothetical protein
MKKVSTVAAKQSKKISQKKLTIGLDLGDRNSWYCVLQKTPAFYQFQSIAHCSKIRMRPQLRKIETVKTGPGTSVALP